MKMSLCNSFRFLAVYTAVVVSIVGSPVPGLLNRQDNIATKEITEELEQQGSITVELKTDLKRPNDISNLKTNNVKDDTNSIPLDSEGLKKSSNKGAYQISTSTEKTETKSIDTEYNNKTSPTPVELSTETILVTTAFNVTLVIQQDHNVTGHLDSTNPTIGVQTIENNTESRNQNNETSTAALEVSKVTSLPDASERSITNTQKEIISANFTSTENPTESSATSPTWKKYSSIDRKRVATTTTSTDEPITSTDTSTNLVENMQTTISEQPKAVRDKSEVMVKSESAQTHISLQDAITSDIPSLDKLKSDLLSSPKMNTKSDIESTTPLPSTEENITETDLTTITISNPNSELLNTVSSMRAGYLNLSMKNSTTDNDTGLKLNGTESLQGPFDVVAQEESSDDKAEGRVESQSQLAEDAIKEELLKEEILNDSKENSKRLRDERKPIETNSATASNTNNPNITQLPEKDVQRPSTAPDDNLSVKPINLDKIKNTILYPVNPNYKPLKKIEVQPAKPFVRDPDDNSWRNESLSSLGIVFKPKNSSKPFTQVLKNKTETEWNNLSEKDRKNENEVPDLRVRLEQIAQKRKSKKKKIDLLGNVYYTDYEESSSSEENITTPKVEDPPVSTASTTDEPTTSVMIVTPVENSPFSTPSASNSEAIDISALTTTPTPTEKFQIIPKKEPTKVPKQKSHRLFNLFDYYETNEDEDITDYLNMAKIDLKKFTVPIHTTYTPYTSPPLPILYTNPMTQYTEARKGTIQYFPPRPTKRPRKNKQNNRDKINSVPLSDSSKHDLPVSYHKLTTPYASSVYYTNRPEMPRKDDYDPKNFERNLYLTTPPLTTLPDDDFGVIGNEGIYSRPNYVMRHYKDYMKEATQSDHSKHRGFPLTEPPELDTITEYIKPTTVKEKTTTDDFDYESQFRKDIIDRFVANFNEKSNRFKSDFPIVYNNSIVHGPSYDDKEVAMSRAYFRRPYSDPEIKPVVHDPYDPNCDNVTVELSPAYELHYYVPDQEEKQEVEAKPINLPVGYRL